MLVLTRRLEEGIVITMPGGDTVTVTVFAVEGDRVKLGIDAPRRVTVLRQELCEAVRHQNLVAARLAEPDTPTPSGETMLTNVRQLLMGAPGDSTEGRASQDP